MKTNEVVNRTKIVNGLGKAMGIASFMMDNEDMPSETVYKFMKEMLDSALKEITLGLWGDENV